MYQHDVIPEEQVLARQRTARSEQRKPATPTYALVHSSN